MNIIFPRTNPIVFNVGNYEPYEDAMKYEVQRDFLQQFAESDRISFQGKTSITSHSLPNALRLNLYFEVNGERTEYISNDGWVYPYSNSGTYPNFFSKLYINREERPPTSTGIFVFSMKISEILINGQRVIKDGDVFRIILKFNDTLFASNYLNCCNDIKDTKLISYTQSNSNCEDFDTLFSLVPKGYNIRVPAKFISVAQKADKEVFQAYNGKFSLVGAMPYETTTLQIGLINGIGIPDWLIRNLNVIFHTDTKLIDGVRYELTDSSDFSVEKISGYGNRFISVELSKKDGDSLKIGGLTGTISVNVTRLNKYETAGKITVLGIDRPYYIDGDSNFLLYFLDKTTSNKNDEFAFTAIKNTTTQDIFTNVVIRDLITDDILKEVTLELPVFSDGICNWKICETFRISQKLTS